MIENNFTIERIYECRNCGHRYNEDVIVSRQYDCPYCNDPEHTDEREHIAKLEAALKAATDLIEDIRKLMEEYYGNAKVI